MSENRELEAPTWFKDIRFFFDDIDVEHMSRRGRDLGTYEGVKRGAVSILNRVKRGAMQPMPPLPDRRWSEEKVEMFKAWITAGYPKGSPATTVSLFQDAGKTAVNASRIRKDLREVRGGELEKLKFAFQSVMDRPPSEATSYFSLAAIHGADCVHHENRYNPWHRVFMFLFEEVLRTVEGCEDVTLPYWDITGPIPEVLFEAPFDRYEIPQSLSKSLRKGQLTERYSPREIEKRLKEKDVSGKIEGALGSVYWDAGTVERSGFNGSIISAHDDGHMATGRTMSSQDSAAFDPIFWFFHANWDRLWWKWQEENHATTLARFKGTLRSSDTDWLDTPPFNELPPFSDGPHFFNAGETIDLTGRFDVDYRHPADSEVTAKRQPTAASALARERFSVADKNLVVVYVRGVQRLDIPGSFTVHLLRDGEGIAQQGFFQPDAPRTCENCSKNGLVDFAFELPLEEVAEGSLSVAIELPENEIGKWFPVASAGNPTIDIRLQLKDE